MAVATLIGEAPRRGAAMYCTSSGWMIGPIWYGSEAAEHIEAFLEWMGNLGWHVYRQRIFGGDDQLRRERVGFGEGKDPRDWTDMGLEKIIVFWRHEYLDEDGFFKTDEEGNPIIRERDTADV